MQQSLKAQTTAMQSPEAGAQILGAPLQRPDEHAGDKAAVDAVVLNTMQWHRGLTTCMR